jgi:hypothetical protein
MDCLVKDLAIHILHMRQFQVFGTSISLFCRVHVINFFFLEKSTFNFIELF